MFENGEPGIVLKTVKCFNIKNSYYEFDLVLNIKYKNSFKLGFFFLDKTQSFNLCSLLTSSFKNGQTVNFGINVPSNYQLDFCRLILAFHHVAINQTFLFGD